MERIVLALIALMTMGAGSALAQEGRSLEGPQDSLRTEVAAVVTLRVETAGGDWLRMKLRPRQIGTIEFLESGRRYGIRPELGSGPDDDVTIEVITYREREVEGLRVQDRETLQAKVGFPSVPSVTDLFQVELESVDFVAQVSGRNPAFQNVHSAVSHVGESELTSQCCITCNDIESCGCFVGASCGSCCDCCEVPSP